MTRQPYDPANFESKVQEARLEAFPLDVAFAIVQFTDQFCEQEIQSIQNNPGDWRIGRWQYAHDVLVAECQVATEQIAAYQAALLLQLSRSSSQSVKLAALSCAPAISRQ